MWSHTEPKIVEIRRLAGCNLSSEYIFKIAEKLPSGNRVVGSKPLVSLSRDIYKKAYSRDVDDFVKNLLQFCDVEWIGLTPQSQQQIRQRRRPVALSSVHEAIRLLYRPRRRDVLASRVFRYSHDLFHRTFSPCAPPTPTGRYMEVIGYRQYVSQ